MSCMTNDRTDVIESVLLSAKTLIPCTVNILITIKPICIY